MNEFERKRMTSLSGEIHAIVLVALSSHAHRDPQKTADRLARCKEVESVDILTGNWDLALEVKTKTPEALYDFLKRTIFREGEIVKTNSLISLKRIKHSAS